MLSSSNTWAHAVLNRINVLILVAYVPMLFATAMSFDAPGSGKHWTHWLFVFSSVSLGPLGLIGRLVSKYRWAGLSGVVLFGLSVVLLETICNGTFTCY